MKFSDFSDKTLVSSIVKRLHKIAPQGNKTYTLMEVCGTHTMAFFRFGVKYMMPKSIRVVAGPGCPVCVTPQALIDTAIELSNYSTILTYGDMFRVPGSQGSLEKAKSTGKDVRIVYSTIEALDIAIKNPEQPFVFLAIGFETTTPATASILVKAKEKNLNNFFILNGHKIIPPAIDALCSTNPNIDGFMMPGHVSAIIGCEPYQIIADKYKIPCVVTGFEAVDILESVLRLVEQINKSESRVENAYSRSVKWEGNTVARNLIYSVFRTSDSEWRGLGCIPGSGLKLNKEFQIFDAIKKFNIKPKTTPSIDKSCRCGDILRGIAEPKECKNFGKRCTPEAPIGPCMVSSEGTCAAYFKYGR